MFDEVDAAEPTAEAEEVEPTGEDDQIDDPVRIYLMQMGEIPMLSHEEETAIARRIMQKPPSIPPLPVGHRHNASGGDGLLENVRDNKLRLDRTIDVSVVNVREKARLLKVLPPNLGRSTIYVAEQTRFRLGHQPTGSARSFAARPGAGC